MPGDGHSGGYVRQGMQIGLTIAALRVLEARRANPLLFDEHARTILEAVGDPHTLALLDAGLREEPSTVNELRTSLLTNYAAAMCRYYDESLLACVENGTRQVVVLAGGLDTRAYRLSWPAGTVVYEVDYAEVLTLKMKALDNAGAEPLTTQRMVLCGLGDQWQAELTLAGFDPDAPTAWLAESVICNLPGGSQDTMFERIIEMSAPGSTISTDNDAVAPSGRAWGNVVDAILPDALRGADYSALAHYDERTPPGDWLSGHGWLTRTRTTRELAQRYGRPFGDALTPDFDDLADRRFLTATLPSDYLAHSAQQPACDEPTAP
ncbi:putative S-adenosyl-L-methionine-dependent methyltransferase [Mycobacteroides salmoniphilum]|uniref:S-adenosyl-L-methionine-dependent methyltransferase n=1 Tax=Mycobacteroides salmoniphilum TaxID=404941 RepID=A0A4R8S6D9_9MYCO|nr:SAM-dependent methyltransferase [Mycobacteroides salmoniphilum]TDZ82212.1 putative S-adenosyl-L-methionine-dependent methyltransferase [Mycobacteroides salmoniphilum]TDZ86180.1 putative S-adenosyl-L-methionine-dependent methyltransferase [Mycobacteroides salmoniphilum]TDZ86531.1 putative S-adenosyl-L-methionine-dependent methyltransferase [Mycobacteroides salmoniphilum]